MPSKKKKYNSRFPPARIKKIMQSDEEVGKVAQVVPIIISKALEIFVASLLQSSSDITRSRNARTLTPTHIKQSILSSDQFKFLRELAQTIPDVNPGAEGEEEEGVVNANTSGGQQMGAQSIQRRVSENRTTIATTSAGHQLSSTGQTAPISFNRGRGRPRKRLIVESQSSVRSIEEPEDEEETEEEDDDEEDADEEDDHNSDNNNRINSNQQIVNKNNNNNNLSDNNFNSSNNFSVINTNCYYSSTQTNPSPFVSTIQSMATSSAASLKPKVIEEDDDYDN